MKLNSKQNVFLALSCIAIIFAMQSAHAQPAAECYTKGQELRKQGKLEEAIVFYTKAIKLDPENAKLYAARSYAEITLVTQHSQSNDHSNFKKVVMIDNAQGIQNLTNAILDSKKATDLDPKLAEAHYASGLTELMLGDKARASEQFKQAIKLNPNYAEAKLELAKIE